MAKYFFLFSLLLVSCSNTQTPFCSCLEAGKKLNASIEKGRKNGLSESIKDEIEQSKREQFKLCKEFQFMDGPKMLELKKECEQ